MKRTEIAKLRPPSYCVIPYQAFEAAGFEQEIRSRVHCESMYFSQVTPKFMNHCTGVCVCVRACVRARSRVEIISSKMSRFLIHSIRH